MYGKNLYETLIEFEVRIDALVSRMCPLEKLGDNIDMVGKWLLKNTDRIKILEQRVGEIIRGDAHTEHRIDALEKTTWHKHTDMTGKWLITNTNRIKELEHRVPELKCLNTQVEKLTREMKCLQNR